MLQRNKSGAVTFPSLQWGMVSDEAKDLLSLMLSLDPETRPSASQTLQHEWLRSVRAPRECYPTIIATGSCALGKNSLPLNTATAPPTPLLLVVRLGERNRA